MPLSPWQKTGHPSSYLDAWNLPSALYYFILPELFQVQIHFLQEEETFVTQPLGERGRQIKHFMGGILFKKVNGGR